MPRKGVAFNDILDRPLDAELEASRGALIQERQADLRALTGHHDDMVRELFHMTRYGMMLEYNRTAAKQDNADVFQSFASEYNLLRDAPAGVVQRKTRKAQADFYSTLSTPSQKSSAPGPSGRSISSSTQPSVPGPSGSPESQRPTKKKRTLDHTSHDEGIGDSISVPQRRTSKASYPPSLPTTPPPSRPHRSSRPPRRYRDDKEPSSQTPTQSHSGTKPYHAKRKIPHSLSPPPSEPPSTPSTRSPSPLPPPPSDFSAIKRVRLIVRPPPPMISHPEQRPGSREHDGRLDAFLNSYIIIDDEEVEPSAMQNIIQEEATLRERGREMNLQGRLRPHFEDGADEHDCRAFYASTPHDVWSTIIDSVLEQHSIHSETMTSQQCSRHVASLVLARVQEAENQQLAEERAEERRLLRLAKTVANLVLDEWRKAVFHLREQQRLQEEEEERQRGEEHLDAMLDQSGQILEAQQAALLRADSSRSASVRSASSSEDVDDPVSGVTSESGSSTEVDDSDDESLHELGLASLLDVTSREPRTHRHRSHRRSETISSNRSSSLGINLSASSPRNSSASILALDLDLELPTPDPSDPQLAPPVLSSSSSTASNSTPPPPDLPDGASLPNTSEQPSIRIALPSLQESLVTADANPDLDTHKKPRSHFSEHSVPPSDPKDGDREASAVAKGMTEPLPELLAHLKPYAAAPVRWDQRVRVSAPFLLRGNLRPYQQAGLEWLISLHNGNTNGILADEMGLGKTIQTISMLAHLACDRGIWGPHLVVVPTSVILNWEMEFKKFLPGFKVLSYHGIATRRKELRKGWNAKDTFNVCITSYTLAARDHHVFKRKAWYYMILDEAHMIKNFKSQRWSILLGFNSFRRLLLTGTPLQNNLTELWALLQFLMSGSNFADRKEFAEWFANPLEKAVELGEVSSDENQYRVSKLHSILRPHLLRRLKQDVEKELPKKYEHLVLCPLSKRQRFLYDEFMSRRQTAEDLGSGMYYRIANILMQLRKVCNHPDLFEVRPIVTSFAMSRSAVADFEVKELLIRQRLFFEDQPPTYGVPGLRFIDAVNTSQLVYVGPSRAEDLSLFIIPLGTPVPKDTRSVSGFKAYREYQSRSQAIVRRMDMNRSNRMRCSVSAPVLSAEAIVRVRSLIDPLVPLSELDQRHRYLSTPSIVCALVLSYSDRAAQMNELVDRFACVTPPVVAVDLSHMALAGATYGALPACDPNLSTFQILHRPSVKLQIAFPDSSLLQYDCGKLQELNRLLRERKADGHRVLLFTQMTKVLDIIESFLNLHGYLYLRLDGSTKIEDRQYITERFNSDARIFCFISSSRSGGVGINLTGADTVIFYDSDFNPQMDRQCEDRAHRIGQIRDVHIYRFVSKHTVEEALLRKANQKRSLDALVIQRGEFDWRTIFGNHDLAALDDALGTLDDAEDAQAARAALREAIEVEGADNADFESGELGTVASESSSNQAPIPMDGAEEAGVVADPAEEEEGGTTVDYMLQYVVRDEECKYFSDWV